MTKVLLVYWQARQLLDARKSVLVELEGWAQVDQLIDHSESSSHGFDGTEACPLFLSPPSPLSRRGVWQNAIHVDSASTSTVVHCAMCHHLGLAAANSSHCRVLMQENLVANADYLG